MNAKDFSLALAGAITVAAGLYAWTWIGCAMLDECWNELTIPTVEYTR